MKKEIVFVAVLAAILGAALTLIAAFFLLPVPAPAPVAASAPPGSAAAAETLQQSFHQAIEAAMPAVVLISAQKRVGVVRSPYFNLFDYDRQRQIDYYNVPSGQGSGFFISAEGHILTNYHVVRDQDAFWITTHDGKEYPAEVVGVDPPTDLAVLKITAERPFPILRFADPERVEIGHWAIAIGAPFNLSRTVTIGIVSNKKRSGVGVNLHESYIQTDASINPGNSGGPLLNLAGEVIGVNDFIMSPSGGNIGLSFAISAEIAGKVAGLLIRDGAVERPWLGIQLEGLNREEREKRRLEHGILVRRVMPDSPAAGRLQAGDVLLAADGVPLDSPHELQGRVFSSAPGRTLSLELLRGGHPLKADIPLRPAPRHWFRFQQQTRNATLVDSL